LKGAFLDVGAGLTGQLPNIIVFQFNPETISRTPTMQQPPPRSDGSGRQDAYQQPDEPSESISFSLRIDATDQLAGPKPTVAAASGILPTLSALELLMQRRDPRRVDLAALSGSSSGALNPPASLPTVLFFWGLWRVLPVVFTSMSITETDFDVTLNPIRAEVYVSLDVLTPAWIAPSDTLGQDAYAYTFALKRRLAALNAENALDIGVSASQSIAL
jgi:hypothetical protein